MKVSCLQENLAKGLSIVGRAVSPRSTLPVLGNVLLATDEGRLKLSATNLEVGINCWIGAKVEEAGSVTVPARTLIDLVNSFPPDKVDMDLTARTQTLNLNCGRSQAHVKGIDAQEFPPVPVPEGSGGIPIQADVLRKAIEQVVFAAATDESRPILTGVQAKFDGRQLTLAAADGFRVSVRTAPLPVPIEESFGIIIPARALAELGRISGEQEHPVNIYVTPTHNQVLFELTDVVLVSQLIDGNFPDLRAIIPRQFTTKTVLETAPWLKACKAASIFARESANITRLRIATGDELAPGRIVVSATSAETGDGVSEMDAQVEGQSIEIAFNVKYLIDVLSVVSTPQIVLETTTPSSPGLLRPSEGDEFVHVIMPMHIGR